MVTSGTHGRSRVSRAGEWVVLVVVSYLPFVLSSPGRVTADSKQALYIDPERFLSGAASLWDPGFGGGTVPHQHIGYLWPMGPWFWVTDQLGIPDWFAQRLWLGTLTLGAALGARWLLRSLGTTRAAAVAGALVYALTPYQLAFTARMSVLLLPWVGLPVLVELTRRALRRGGWRHPALFALVVATVAGVNATSLALVGFGPLLVLAHEAAQGRDGVRVAATATAKVGLLSVLVSAWWLAGLRVQGSHGMPVLQLTENLTDISRWSNPGDVLRGFGNWFFAGRDRLGYSVDQADVYLDSGWGVALSLVVPCLALGVAVLLGGRIRTLMVSFLVVATVVAVGAWPYDRSSPFGRLFRSFAEETTVGLALRNSHRIVPLLVLAMATLLALGVTRLPRARDRNWAAGAVALAALAGLAPVVSTGMLSDRVDRPEALPDHWIDAARHLDERAVDDMGNPSRVLEVPGTPFAAYRWGNTIEPVLPSLIDRPQIGREVLPYGSAATMNLLDALDRRIQERTFEIDSLAPLARLFAVSDVALRGDLEFERFATPEPSGLWWEIIGATASGLGATTSFGTAAVNEPDRQLAPLTERDLVYGAIIGAQPPLSGGPVAPVSVRVIDEPTGVIALGPVEGGVVIVGDGDGIVDAAAAGLIDGAAPVVYLDGLDDATLETVLGADAHLILTDSQRRRIQTWFYAIRDTRGPTERAGETLTEPTGYDVRLESVAGLTDASRSVTEQIGGQVTATLTGGAARPEDRAVAAFDDDLATAWRVGGFDPRGHRISVTLDAPRSLDSLKLIQPLDGPRDRVIETVRIHFDAGAPIDATLDERSLDPSGQIVEFTERLVERFEVEITGVSDPGFDPALANAVGFAEVRVGDLRIAEPVRLPTILADRVGPLALDHGLDIVVSRLRYDPYDRGRTDPERRIDRLVDLAAAREFGLGGLARVNPTAPDQMLDALLLEGTQARFSSSSRLRGDVTARAAAAFDGDPTTAWTTAFGPQDGQWIEVELAEPISIDSVGIEVVVDDMHSIPIRIAVEIDGVALAEATMVALHGAPVGATHRVDVTVDASAAQRLRVVVEAVERRSARPGDLAPMQTLPVAIRDIDLGNPATGFTTLDQIDSGCRDDLLTIAGTSRAVRVTGAAAEIRTGLTVEPCGEPVRLPAGMSRLETAPGHETGLDLDRLVLSSGPGGDAAPIGVRGRSGEAGATLVDLEMGRTEIDVVIETTGAPTWLVLAQSHSLGWVARADGVDLGPPVLIDGFANGWLIEPDAAGTLTVELRWTPQRLVWFALAVSLFAVGLCAGVVVGTRPTVVAASISVEALWVVPRWTLTTVRIPDPMVGATAILVAVGTAAVSRPWIGAAAGLMALAIAVAPVARLAVAVVAPASLVASFWLDRPTWAWLAIACVVAATCAPSGRRRE